MIKKTTVVLLVTLFLILAWAVSPSQVPAKEKFVTVLATGPLTGPAASLILPIYHGIKDSITELNANGGIEGVKVKLIAADSRYDVARCISFYMRHRREPRLVLLYVFGTPHTYALHPMITRDKLPTVGGGARFTLKPGYVFITTPPYSDMFGGAMDWMMEDWKKKGKSGMPTVGFLGWAGGSGRDNINGADKYAEQKGIKLLPPEYFPPGSLKLDTWLIRLANSGANYIYIFGLDPDPTFALRDAYNLGLTKKIQFVSSPYGFVSMVGLKLVPPEVFEGAVASSTYIIGDERLKHPFAKLYSKYQKKPVTEMYPGYLLGVSDAKTLEKALKIAYKEVGYEKLNREAVYQGLQKVAGDVTQGATGPVVWGPKKRMFNDSLKFYRITKGKHVPLGGWRKTPDCTSLATFK